MRFSLTIIALIGHIVLVLASHSFISTRRATSSGQGAPTVTVKNGTIAGVRSNTYNEDHFLGIPFAQPPVGDLRFRNPQSNNKTFNGTYQATEYAPECYGYGNDQLGNPQSDDCLYLNVIRPSGYENQSLPVGVWIHGGGLGEGGTRDERYNLTFIVQNSVEIGKPMIAAAIAYRLGPWGFLNSEQVSGSGNTNIGLRDQRLALHWINENIAAFGGDKDKVTIWGESAGAASVGWHLLAYNGRDDGLFRAGIMESGNPLNYNNYLSNEDYQPNYNNLLNATGCTNALDTLQCLREVNVNVLQNLFNSTSDLTSGWSPIVDGDFIARWGSLQLRDGAFVKVPIIDGANTDEGTAFGPRGVNTTADFATQIENVGSARSLPAHFVPEVLDAYPNEPAYWIPPVEDIGNYTYPASYGAQYRRSAAYFGDVVMIANRRGTCEAWAANSVPAYSYRFNTIPAGLSIRLGATHFQEVAFVFDNTQGLGYNALHNSSNPFAGKPQAYYDLAKLMSKSWASFIHDLDPNSFKGRLEGAPIWPKYNVEHPENIVFDANATGVAFVEPDTFRKEGIRWILDHALAYRR